jgi:hypothetical protein
MPELTIALKFTIVHHGEDGRVPKSHIDAQIKELNNAYRGRTHDEVGYPTDHLGSLDAVDSKINFVLAKDVPGQAAITYVCGLFAPPRMIPLAQPLFVFNAHAIGVPMGVHEWCTIRIQVHLVEFDFIVAKY